MKNIKRIARTIIIGIFISGLLAGFSGCQKADPLSSSAAVTKNTAAGQEFNILSFKGKNNRSLNKTTTVSKFIKANRGGTLYLEHEHGDLDVEISLTIPRNSMSENAEIEISLNDDQFLGAVDVVFQPHGITFSRPAILNIDAKGLDMSGVNPNDIDLYYVNEESGQWEQMQYDDLDVDIDDGEGEIEVKDARLPHFSRYALSND